MVSEDSKPRYSLEEGKVTLHPADFRQLLREPENAYKLIDLSHYPHCFLARTSFYGECSRYYEFSEASLGHNDNGLYELTLEIENADSSGN